MNRYVCYVTEGRNLGKVQIDYRYGLESFLGALGDGTWFTEVNGRSVNPVAIVYVDPPYKVEE